LSIFKLEKLINEEECIELVNMFDNYNYVQKDYQVIGSLAIRKPDFLIPIHNRLKPVIESKTNFKLKCRFYAIRKYVKGNLLKKHVDNASDWAVTIPILQSDDLNNPIVIYPDNTAVSYNLKQGDGLFFNGRKVFHERPPIQSAFLYHLYLGFKKIDIL